MCPFPATFHTPVIAGLSLRYTEQSVIDGDTLKLRVSLGFGVYKHIKVRLASIQCPEVRGHERASGLKARQCLINLVRGKTLVLQTQRASSRNVCDRTGKYGRYIGKLFADDVCVNAELVKSGHAVAI